MSATALDIPNLIQEYKSTGDISIRNKLILHYGGLVKSIAISTRNLYLKYAEVDDIINEGLIALISALDTFDFEKNVKFETYATLKVRGAIIDFIRKQDFIPRSVRRFSKELDSAFAKLYHELHREPTSLELSEKMGVPLDKFHKMMGDVASANTLSFEELLYENNFEPSLNASLINSGTTKNLYEKELVQEISKAIDRLNEKERMVVTLYYYEKLKLSDIGKVMQVSESRISQIHSKAISKLKLQIGEYLKEH